MPRGLVGHWQRRRERGRGKEREELSSGGFSLLLLLLLPLRRERGVVGSSVCSDAIDANVASLGWLTGGRHVVKCRQKEKKKKEGRRGKHLMTEKRRGRRKMPLSSLICQMPLHYFHK